MLSPVVRACPSGLKSANLRSASGRKRDFRSVCNHEKKTGLGIGLVVSRLITEAHGGRLWAENNPSGGATFCLALPLNSRSQLSTANGHIHQDYLKVDGEWKITRSHTSRLFVDEQWL